MQGGPQWKRNSRLNGKVERKDPVPFAANASSQWKQLRQTVGATSGVPLKSQIRIIHLCPEDKEKVGKLIRQLMKVGHENEDLKRIIQEMQAVQENVATDKAELHEQLNQALEILKKYQDRIHAMQLQCDSERDKYKNAVAALDENNIQQDLLNKKIASQQHELELLRLDNDTAFQKETRRLSLELHNVHEDLVQERRKRLNLQEELDEARVRLEEQKQESVEIASVLTLPSNEKMRSIVHGWTQRLEAALEAPTKSAGTQTDDIERQNVGVQCENTPPSRIIDEPTSKPRPVSLMDQPLIRPTIVDSEFYDMSLFDLVHALETEPSEDLDPNDLLSPGDLSIRATVDLDIEAIMAIEGLM